MGFTGALSNRSLRHAVRQAGRQILRKRNAPLPPPSATYLLIPRSPSSPTLAQRYLESIHHACSLCRSLCARGLVHTGYLVVCCVVLCWRQKKGALCGPSPDAAAAVRPIFCRFFANYSNRNVTWFVLMFFFLLLQPWCGYDILAGAQAEDGGGKAARPQGVGEEARPLFASGRRRRRFGEGKIIESRCLFDSRATAPLSLRTRSERISLGDRILKCRSAFGPILDSDVAVAATVACLSLL